ncbi:MAG: DUF4402 domain-containing protein [Bacteroidia bacterium]|nr:DUF4402 domain-containing protein [Bacteroidia bacterium]
MKQIIRILTVAVVMIAYSVSASAQGSATTSGNAAARIIAPITLTVGTTLDFGTIYNTGGTVIISTAGVRSGTAAVKATPVPTAGTFTVAGEPTLTYAITLPADGVVTIASGVNTMPINSFVSNPATTSTIPGGGSETLSIGATLTVAAGQASGNYTGTYSVTVQYN